MMATRTIKTTFYMPVGSDPKDIRERAIQNLNLEARNHTLKVYREAEILRTEIFGPLRCFTAKAEVEVK